MERKKRIAFLLPSSALPVPVKKGGAIETLMTIMLDQNEKEKRYDFIFISPDENDRIEEWECSRSYLLSDKGERKEFVYDHKANQIIKDEKVDYLLMEGLASRIDGCFRGTVEKERMAIHLHSPASRRGIYCDTFGVTIAPSQYIAKMWNKDAQENVKRTFLWRNAINIRQFGNRITYEERQKMRQKMNFTEDDFVVIFCGRLAREKGVKELLNAILEISDSNIKLLLVGSDSFANGNKGDYSKEILKLAQAHSEKITYMGFIDNTMMPEVYQCADMQVIPSLWEEPFGLVALEGMCSKLPILYTDSGALPELIPKKAGIMIRKDEPIERQLVEKIKWLKNNASQRAKMSKIAFDYVQNYSSKQYYEDFEKLINWWEKLMNQ